MKFQPRLLIISREKSGYRSFESLPVCPTQTGKLKKTVLLVTVYHPPSPYSEFLSEFSELLSELVISADKIIVMGDFNFHVSVESDSPSSAFLSL